MYLLAVVLIVGWLLGFGVFGLAGGLIHVLLVVAIIAILWQLMRGRRKLG